MGADPAADEQFGPYSVYERLGVGGMATVHRALERGIEGFERYVALKRLLPHLAEDASFIKSFVREAKLASALTHVNIVQIYELGRVGTEYFISMEYIDGRDIRRILRHARRVTGPPPINITVGMLMQLCDALDYAHTKTDDQGQPMLLVHRDVSPSNVLVTSQGHLKVIDFGIAKAQSSQLRTQTGRVKGKLAYMAPEAVSGSKDLDARSDLWAVGVIASELLTARPLFASRNEYQTLLKVQRGDIMPPSTFNQACPPELDAIVAKALERDPDARYASAAEMREDLTALRYRKGLATGYRDIANWIEWAFSIEAPSGGFAATTSFEKTSGTVTPHPRPATKQEKEEKRDEEEAVEIAWGGGDGDANNGEAIVLDDVPDVSEKMAQAVVSRDLDDIPAAQPSHSRSRTGMQPQAPRSGMVAEPRPPATEPTGHPVVDGLEATIEDSIEVDLESTPKPTELPIPQPVPRTKPGIGEPIRVRTPTSLPALEDPPAVTARRSAPLPVTIGQAMVERETKPRSTWPWLVGLLVVGGAAAGVAVYVTRGKGVPDPAPGPKLPVAQVGTVKFLTEPTDAEVRIEGLPPHTGSPWAIELAAGTHQIEVHHDGFKAWLSSVDVGPGETNVIRVALGPLGSTASPDAMLMLGASTPGLEVVLDGHALDVRTPLKMPIKIGPHTVALRANGVEVWKNAINAQAATDYTFDPAFTPAKQALRAQWKPPTAPEPRVDEPTPKPEPKVEAPVEPPPPVPVPPPPPVDQPKRVFVDPTTPPPPKPVVTVAPPPRPVVIETPRPLVAVTVAPSAVTKLSGEVPKLGIAKNVDLPPVVAAKLCIDVDGKVTSAQTISKIEHHASEDLADVLRTWHYAPYRAAGTPAPACFVVSFKTR